MAGVEVIGPRGPVRAVCLLVHGRGQVPADMVRMVVDHVPVGGCALGHAGGRGQELVQGEGG